MFRSLIVGALAALVLLAPPVESQANGRFVFRSRTRVIGVGGAGFVGVGGGYVGAGYVGAGYGGGYYGGFRVAGFRTAGFAYYNPPALVAPTYVQPVYVQPTYVQPTYVQPTYVQPVQAAPECECPVQQPQQQYNYYYQPQPVQPVQPIAPMRPVQPVQPIAPEQADCPSGPQQVILPDRVNYGNQVLAINTAVPTYTRNRVLFIQNNHAVRAVQNVRVRQVAVVDHPHVQPVANVHVAQVQVQAANVKQKQIVRERVVQRPTRTVQTSFAFSRTVSRN